MKKVSIYKPENLSDALDALTSTEGASVYAGGSDLLVRLKNSLDSAPGVLVDIKGLDDLHFMRYSEDEGMVIGALATLGEISEWDAIGRYPSIAETIQYISSPELRNQSTVGGNLLQEVWCPYLRSNYRCWRNGGDICYAEIGDNTEYQSIMGAKKSYAAYPGDLAVTLLALDATARVLSPGGEREMTIDELIPGEFEYGGRIQSHSLKRNEILASVKVPPPARGEACVFGKVRKREVWDFASASLALKLTISDGEISEARAVFGGIATRPWRDERLESFLSGKRLDASLADSAAGEALVGAKPLEHNAYKKDQAIGLLNSMLEGIVSGRLRN